MTTDARLAARVERGACRVCAHGRADPIHDPRCSGFHEYDRLAATPVPLDRERLFREALEIIATPPVDAPDAIGVKARNIALAALAQPTEDEGQPDVDRMRAAARRARLPREVSVADIENLAREYGHACCSGCNDTGHCTHGYEVAQPTEEAE